MTYETIASISQITSLIMFIGMFLAVVAYALWPANGQRFEAAQRQALDLEGPTANVDRPKAWGQK